MKNVLEKDGDGIVGAERVRRAIQSRVNPLRGLTPARVTRALEDFRRGYYREVAWLMEVVEDCDDKLKVVAGKRKKAVARLDWDIVELEGARKRYGDARVERQREGLKHFYDNLSARHAVDSSERGGLGLLIRQMMDAVGKRYAVHEILWRPDGRGGLTAEFVQVPLWFFEGLEGRLRFLQGEGEYEGIELEPEQWMVTVGEGLMVASLIAYIYKSLSLKDWVTYSEKHGMPAITMHVDAAPGSAEWTEAYNAVQEIASEFAGVASRSAELKVTDLKGGGNAPYAELVERMDRAITALWRGGDLSTMSGENQLGASMQQGESDVLEEADVAVVTETLNHQVDRTVRRFLFGEDEPGLCFFRLQSPDREDEQAALAKVRTAVEMGCPVSRHWFAEKFGIQMAEREEDVLGRPRSGSGKLEGREATEGLEKPEREDA